MHVHTTGVCYTCFGLLIHFRPALSIGIYNVYFIFPLQAENLLLDENFNIKIAGTSVCLFVSLQFPSPDNYTCWFHPLDQFSFCMYNDKSVIPLPMSNAHLLFKW